MDPDNRLPINLVHIPADMREYFDILKHKHGIETDGMQQAWYVKTREFLGPDSMMKAEHPSTPDECFFASLEGAYFKTEMNLARRDKRIGLPVPHDPTRPVHTYWDLGWTATWPSGLCRPTGFGTAISICARRACRAVGRHPDFERKGSKPAGFPTASITGRTIWKRGTGRTWGIHGADAERGRRGARDRVYRGAAGRRQGGLNRGGAAADKYELFLRGLCRRSRRVLGQLHKTVE
jgi:hypothetical protein